MERLDLIIVKKGFARSRDRAKELIKNGSVAVNGNVISKASLAVDENAEITVAKRDGEYVSRGAYKLKHALDEFNIDLSGRTCIDIGASTGGFTQVMLKAGANRVYAVDVGHDQLDEMLTSDERVISMEGINFRYMDLSSINDKIYFAAADLSFISLKLILQNAYDILSEDGEMVALIKPQFEAGRENIGKHGIVKDEKVHIEVIKGITDFCESTGFIIKGLTKSPLKGGEGNTEYLVYITKQNDKNAEDGLKIDINAVVSG